MTYGSELRAAIVMVLVVVAIIIAFARLSTAEDETEASATTTAPPTTTIPPTTTLSQAQKDDLLCAAAEDYIREAYSYLDQPAIVARIGEPFFAEALTLTTGAVRAEYEAAADYFVSYNDVGEAFGYDHDTILREGDGLRWEQLVTRPDAGVIAARAHLFYLCDLVTPEQPLDIEAFDAAKAAIQREEDDRIRREAEAAREAAASPPAAPPAPTPAPTG